MLSALQTKFGASMVVANMIGGVVVFVFLGFVLPRPQHYLDANIIALVSYLTFALLAGFVISARAFLPIRSWVLGDAGTTEANRCYVVTHARRQAVINFCIWMVRRSSSSRSTCTTGCKAISTSCRRSLTARSPHVA
jgi:hypothetical protein